MAEARKLAGRVSAESEVTPRRSFSLNIFLQEGERVNVLVPSCQREGAREKGGRSSKDRRLNRPSLLFVFVFFNIICFTMPHLIGPSLGSHGDEGVVLLLQELSGLREERERET